MKKYGCLTLTFILFIAICAHPDEVDFLKISTKVAPPKIRQGREAVILLQIKPKDGIRISSYPDFIIKINNNNNLSFSKSFYVASELDLQIKKENEMAFLDLEKDILLPFKVNDDALIGKTQIEGEIVFTAIFKDNWSLKTYQKFEVDLVLIRNYHLKKQ
jgi:hypothetical protein